jgi:hypothetical protein
MGDSVTDTDPHEDALWLENCVVDSDPYHEELAMGDSVTDTDPHEDALWLEDCVVVNDPHEEAL